MADQARFGAIAARGSPAPHPARAPSRLASGARSVRRTPGARRCGFVGAGADSAPRPPPASPPASQPTGQANAHRKLPSRPSRPAAQPDVSRAIESAARRTGVDFDYLLETARKESALDPQAKARHLERDRALPVHRPDLAWRPEGDGRRARLRGGGGCYHRRAGALQRRRGRARGRHGAAARSAGLGLDGSRAHAAQWRRAAPGASGAPRRGASSTSRT